MATYLLDTTIFSELLRGHRKIQSRMTMHAPAGRVCTCTIVKGEIAYGIERLPSGRRRRNLEARANDLFASMFCEPIPEAAAAYYAQMKQAAQQRGMSVDENDLWIAATAQALGIVLVTRDSDFAKVPGMLIEDWSQ